MFFDIDVLIVYAEKDNEVAKKNEHGWVSQFKKFLELMLLQVQGNKPNIVIKSEFDIATSPALSNAAVLVTILTKEFAESGRCLDVVEAFYKSIPPQTKINRLFKVSKSPLSLQEQPPRLRNLIGYNMYQLDDETGALKDYSDFFSPEAEKQYWMELVDLAYDIDETLLLLKNGEVRPDVKSIYKRKTIYLAETAHDLSVQRNIIKRELQRHGYVVFPDQTLPSSIADMERVIKKDLEEASLSIHLIGGAYGEIPEGADRSIVDLQNKLAAECAVAKKQSKKEFSRLIWIAQNLKNASEKQKTFIESLKRDTEAQEGAETIQNPLEDFKNIMREELIESQDRTSFDELSSKSVYLIYDRVDAAEVKPFQEVIEKSGFKVLLPDFEGTLLEVRKQHIENLKNFDIAIIFKGKVNDQWVHMKVLDLLKAPGFGRKKIIQGKAILGIGYLDRYKNQNLTLIAADHLRSVEALKDFLNEFESQSNS